MCLLSVWVGFWQQRQNPGSKDAGKVLIVFNIVNKMILTRLSHKVFDRRHACEKQRSLVILL